MDFKIAGRAVSDAELDVEGQVIEVVINLEDDDVTFNATNNDAYIGVSLKDLERIISEAKAGLSE